MAECSKENEGYFEQSKMKLLMDKVSAIIPLV